MSEQPKVRLFREKSLEAVESPEALNDYLRVTSPGVWLVMAAVIALLIGGILWGIFGHIRTTGEFAVGITEEKSVCYVPYAAAEKVLASGVVSVKGKDYPLLTDSAPETSLITAKTAPGLLLAGPLRVGDLVIEVPVLTDLPEGFYTGEVVTEDLAPISLLFR